MKRRLRRGVLVAIEGIDGAGKTTQSIRLVERLNALGFEAVRFFEPTDETHEGRIIRESFLQGDAISNRELITLFITDRQYDVETHIAPALSDKKIVVMDRYFLSTAAYQSDDIAWREILEMNREFAPEPDIIFVLICPVEIAMKLLAESGRALTNVENEARLLPIRARYLEMARMDSGNYAVIDDIADVEDVTDEILDTLLSYIYSHDLVEYYVQ
jgi:dTMP kinase